MKILIMRNACIDPESKLKWWKNIFLCDSWLTRLKILMRTKSRLFFKTIGCSSFKMNFHNPLALTLPFYLNNKIYIYSFPNPLIVGYRIHALTCISIHFTSPRIVSILQLMLMQQSSSWKHIMHSLISDKKYRLRQ